MEPNAVNSQQLAASAKHFARRLLTVGEDRLELPMEEVQEGRARLPCAILLVLGVAVFVLLAGVPLRGTIVFLFSSFLPTVALSVMTGFYGTAAFFLFRRLTKLLRACVRCRVLHGSGSILASQTRGSRSEAFLACTPLF
jgi:uncharacterized membrane protein YqjE